MAQRVKRLNPNALVILGNDHFSALYERIMQRQGDVDFGFYGNDVVTGFADFVADSLRGRVKSPDAYPGLVYRAADGTAAKVPEDAGEYTTAAGRLLARGQPPATSGALPARAAVRVLLHARPGAA
jgi:hypothetical protein